MEKEALDDLSQVIPSDRMYLDLAERYCYSYDASFWGIFTLKSLYSQKMRRKSVRWLNWLILTKYLFTLEDPELR